MSDRNKITVVFVNPSAGLSGDTLSLGNLIMSLRNEIEPIVLLSEEKSAAFDYFNSLGAECLAHPYLLLLEPLWGVKIKNVLFHPWRLRFIKKLRFEWPGKLFFIRALKGRHIDFIHTNRSQVKMGYSLAKRLRVPHIWHIREYAFFGSRRIPGGLHRLKRFINQADARIVVSNECRKSWGLKDINTWTIFDAVKSIKDCCYVKKKQPYVLFVSHKVNEVKGANTIVKAFGKSGLYANDIPVCLRIVGDCLESFKNTLLALAEQYGCAAFIDFIPEQKDVKPFFAHAMAFVNPSVNEGLGRTTAEAMFFGCPVIAHASGGTLDLIRDGETGYLFHTEEECARLLKTVCTNNQERIILQAQEFVKQNLSVEYYGEKIMEVYDKVLSKEQN